MIFLSEAVRSAVQSIENKVVGLINYKEQNRRFLNADVFSNPEKYLVRLPIDKIVADKRVFPQTVIAGIFQVGDFWALALKAGFLSRQDIYSPRFYPGKSMLCWNLV